VLGPRLPGGTMEVLLSGRTSAGLGARWSGGTTEGLLLSGRTPGVLGTSGTQTLSNKSDGGGVTGCPTRLNCERDRGDPEWVGVRLPSSDSARAELPGARMRSETVEETSDLRYGSVVNRIV
jgi:hypothetical protein